MRLYVEQNCRLISRTAPTIFKKTGAVMAFALTAVIVYLLPVNAPVALANDYPLVWQADEEKWLRDPNIFGTDAGTYIMTGTQSHVLEYQSLEAGSFEDDDGAPNLVRLFSPNGKRKLRADGFWEWEKKFFQSANGLIMIASLPSVDDFDTDLRKTAGRRSTYVFVQLKHGRTTASGFPLDWKLRSNDPLLMDIYNGSIFDADEDGLFMYADVRNDKTLNTTCIRVQGMSRSLDLKKPRFLLCPGQKVERDTDKSGWDRNTPFPSEVRFEDGGGLLEGAWAWKSPNDKYYIFYSSGDYEDTDLYGGFIAVCKNPNGMCRKIMRDDKNDVRFFVKGSSKNYERIGRAFPVVNKNDELVDIIFHARPRGEKADDILRCTNFHPKLIEEFTKGGPGCEFDDVVYDDDGTPNSGTD